MSASLAPECNEVKERYDSCFLKWYSEKFLRGDSTTDECQPLFKQYKACLTKALKEKGIDEILEEARESNRENDLEHLKRGCRLHGEGDGVNATGQLYDPKKTANCSTRQNGDVLSETESNTPLYAPE
ncbi:MAG: hypothetical protein LQ349_004673 [Xanthoria aureola]|nr:MAG: hypothetical protein LQ349_004673 [Xanthoria aureola]